MNQIFEQEHEEISRKISIHIQHSISSTKRTTSADQSELRNQEEHNVPGDYKINVLEICVVFLLSSFAPSIHDSVLRSIGESVFTRLRYFFNPLLQQLSHDRFT